MRKIPVSILSMIGLAALTVFLWNHRFQELSGPVKLDLPTLVAAHPSPLPPGITWDSEQSALILTKKENQAVIGVDLVLPKFPPVPGLHSSLELQAINLKPNDDPWEDGRVSILWQSDTQDSEVEYLSSVRWNNLTEIASVVSSPETASATAVIRIENMARSGALLVKRLELIAVQETPLWKVGQWILVALWTLWAAFVAGAFHQRSFKPWLAAVLWIIVVLKLVLPGPWHNSRPFGNPYSLGTPNSATMAPPPALITKTVTTTSPARASSEIGQELPPQGGLLLQMRYALRSIRPLLHVGLFFVLTAALILIIRRPTALALIIPIAVGVEAVQIGFGYGFDLDDLFDLAVDGIGIFLAVFALNTWFKRKGNTLWQGEVRS